MTMDLDQLLKSAMSCARKAGNMMLEANVSAAHVAKKGWIDLVTDIDLEINQFLCEELSALHQEIGIIAEEGVPAKLMKPDAEWVWVIDPIDGTTNFVHGLNHSAVSIALFDRAKQESLLGIVHNPYVDECFSAVRGEGAFLNGRAITVSPISSLEDSVIATGFAYDRKANPDNNLAEFAAIMPLTQGLRRFGAASLDLVYVAAGRLDAYFERGLKFWDYAAAMLVVTEAGGQVSAYDGSKLGECSGHVLASNGVLHSSLVTIIGDARVRAGFQVCPEI